MSVNTTLLYLSQTQFFHWMKMMWTSWQTMQPMMLWTTRWRPTDLGVRRFVIWVFLKISDWDLKPRFEILCLKIWDLTCTIRFEICPSLLYNADSILKFNLNCNLILVKWLRLQIYSLITVIDQFKKYLPIEQFYCFFCCSIPLVLAHYEIAEVSSNMCSCAALFWQLSV